MPNLELLYSYTLQRFETQNKYICKNGLVITLSIRYITHMASLYMVATPIGNMQDITLRALDVLKSVSAVACEDTRQSGKLLSHFGISVRTLACHSHNMEASVKGIISLLDSGNEIAYITDAGTPGISDPGSKLSSAARQAGHKVVPIPGPSAYASLVSVSGFSGKGIFFEGFLSPKQGKRKKRLQELMERNEDFIIYESPHRIVKFLQTIVDISPERPVLIGREMTKKYEEYFEGTAAEALAEFSKRDKIYGEFSILVSKEKKR